VREACISDSSSWVCTALQQLAAELSTDSGLVTSIVDAPLQVLELCSEIKCGMWRRNGLSMQEQVMNYAEVPLCKLSRDLDVVALQFGAATAAYSATLLVNHIVHRYRCFDLWLREHTATTATTAAPAGGDTTDISGGSGAAEATAQQAGTTTSGSGTTTAADVHDEEPTAGLLHLVATPEFHTTAAEAVQAVGAMQAVAASQHGGSKQQALSLEHQTLLAEECLTLLVHVVTELPPAPLILTITSTSSSSTVDTSSLHAQLRREMLHKLATGPRTYSELHDACTLVGQGDTTAASTVKVKSSDVDAVLSAIAVQQARPQHVHTRTALEPGKFVLKSEVSSTVIQRSFNGYLTVITYKLVYLLLLSGLVWSDCVR
jgi:hypothetical protein